MSGEQNPEREVDEGRLAREQLVGEDAEGVDVRPMVGRGIGGRLLGGEIRRRTDDQPADGQRHVGRRIQRLRDAEIGEEDVLPAEQDVCGLDVAVDDRLAVRVRQRPADTPEDADGLGDRERAGTPETFAQGLALDVGHREPQQAGGGAGVVDREDVRVLQPGRHADLAHEAGGTQRRGDLVVQHLHRDQSVVLPIAGEVDRRHAPAAELTLDHVAGGEGAGEAVEDLGRDRLAGRHDLSVADRPSGTRPDCASLSVDPPPGRSTRIGGMSLSTSQEVSVTNVQTAMKTPPIVSPEEWEAARLRLLVKEKELTHARDALAAERRRMPWQAVEKEYEFEGPGGKASLLDLFDGRRQLIVYRAFFEPGVEGWPEHACGGCSMLADQVAHLAHLNARDTTLVFVSRAPQADIERLKARMEWEMPWYTLDGRLRCRLRRGRVARHQRVHPFG